jgi:predicted membrane GTPase involved in stress response
MASPTPPRDRRLDRCIQQLNDELLEATPDSLRIRKRILDTHKRGREDKRAKEELGA